MTIKYFCDVCDIEVTDPSFSLDMTGKVLCGKHFTEHEKMSRPEYVKKWVWKGKKIHDKWWTPKAWPTNE